MALGARGRGKIHGIRHILELRDLTADRAGMLLAHNLEIAAEVMRATEDAASVPGKDRMKEIVLFSISEPYLELRQKLGIAIDS